MVEVLIKKINKSFLGFESTPIKIFLENQWSNKVENQLAVLIKELCSVPEVV